MRTIQMTLDDNLVQSVDKVVKDYSKRPDLLSHVMLYEMQ